MPDVVFRVSYILPYEYMIENMKNQNEKEAISPKKIYEKNYDWNGMRFSMKSLNFEICMQGYTLCTHKPKKKCNSNIKNH